MKKNTPVYSKGCGTSGSGEVRGSWPPHSKKTTNFLAHISLYLKSFHWFVISATISREAEKLCHLLGFHGGGCGLWV